MRKLLACLVLIGILALSIPFTADAADTWYEDVQLTHCDDEDPQPLVCEYFAPSQ